MYLAGPVSLGARLAAAGFPNFRQINASNIKDVPPGSVVAVDWGYLIKNINSSSVTNYLEPLLRGHDFIIISINGSDALAAEVAIANAWREAFNSNVVVVPGPGNEDYVVAAAIGSRVLLMGPATASDLGVKRYEWSEFMVSSTRPTSSQLFGLIASSFQPLSSSTAGSDVCEYMASQYNAVPGQVNYINGGNTYFFLTGQEYVYDNQYGIDTDTEYAADFCIAVSGDVNLGAFNNIRYPYIPGNTWTWIWVRPGPGTSINWLSSYQDYYSSYECAKGVVTPDMAPVCPINGVTFAGWGYWWGIYPMAGQDQESYDVGVGISTSGVGFTGGVNVMVPPSTISIYGEPSVALSTNYTWVMQPSVSYAMEPNSLDTATSNFYIVNGALTWGASSFVEIAVPMGVSASVNTGGWMGCTNELASLDMYWLVFYPQPPPSLTPYFHVINWGYAHQSSSTGGWRFSCTGNGLPPQSPPPQS
ncbi:hypothetical protein GCM10007981_08740 [Thermocladium modestius]|uniref:Uncharacterized protein n=1 Tax=Thermocladium modestius TaxID=62609 RepID=A0A830GUW7_9CREN|nr:hypothetical protein GCM10007981_08740 [Thermocladium modestius]